MSCNAPRPRAPEPVRHRSVLVVEDSEFLGAFLLELVSSFPAVAFSRLVATVAQARHALSRFTPDVVLLDLHLPEGGGLPFLRELKKTLPESVVVALSSDLRPESRRECLAAGASAVLDKSADLPPLADVLERLLS
jgi:CheY-like chemotaxis protein